MVDLFNGNVSLADIANILGRSELAIVARLAKLNLRPAVTTQEIKRYRNRATLGLEYTSDVQEAESGNNSNIVEESNPDSLESVSDVQQAFSRFYFVYGIVNHYKEVYIGYSNNVWKRISQHNRGVGAKATKNSGPWYPFSIHCMASEEDARSFENNIHNKFEEYIRSYEKSLKQVLAQIGLPFAISEVTKV